VNSPNVVWPEVSSKPEFSITSVAAGVDWLRRLAMMSDLIISFIDFINGFNLRTRNFQQGGS
jgi:hypothetical protein